MHRARQGLLLLLLALASALFSATYADTLDPRAPADAPAIRVLDGDWGRARPEEIEAVVRSAAAALGRHVDRREPVAIVVVPGTGHPEVRYDRNARGEYVMALSARDRRWAQYAYQFGHEFCHILANFDQRVRADGAPLSQHQWFEETLCEAAALFTLRQMAARWRSSPPLSHWKAYAPWLAEYADGMLAAEHRRHAQVRLLPAWYAEHGAALARDPYARQHNDFCATALLALFENDPPQWNALGYLNLEGAAGEPTFDSYLVRWVSRVPAWHRRFVMTIAAAFAITTAAGGVAASPSLASAANSD